MKLILQKNLFVYQVSDKTLKLDDFYIVMFVSIPLKEFYYQPICKLLIVVSYTDFRFIYILG